MQTTSWKRTVHAFTAALACLIANGCSKEESSSGYAPLLENGCTVDDCGVAPGAPAFECKGSDVIAGPVCSRDKQGSCVWDIVECPDEVPPGDGDGECTKEECAPAVGAPNYICPGSDAIGGPACLRNEDGVCSWHYFECPDEDRQCGKEECGPAPGAPSYECKDGSFGGPVCELNKEGVCGWTFRECPSEE